MPRSTSARLAVLLFIIPPVIAVAAVEGAADDCVTTPAGIECAFSGTTTSTVVTVLPPLRYLVTTTHPTLGPCWFWSRFPPGLDSLDSANDQAILGTRASLPECPIDYDGETSVDTAVRAWEVFRSWTLPGPAPRLRPSVGITNLESRLLTPIPAALSHTETLPDGRLLEVRATVDAVIVDWGDGTPPAAHPPAVLAGPGAAHTYRLKTCPADYRRSHPSGPGCHPTLADYRVGVTFQWTGRYRTGATWMLLGTIPLRAAVAYDVDEVVGIPVRP
jgi:hypothetical protein